ncbi:MAG: MraY family glycosyltransferase [Bacteroidota bacterium]|nr:MraY family glycosyltransferase [Bacteroidota bacterium]
MNDLIVYSVLLFVGALVFNMFLIPKIRGAVSYKGLMDKPNGRSSHSEPTPNLAGIAIYLTLMISFYFTHEFDDNKLIFAILPGLSLLFFGGLKDDLVVLGPFAKILLQVGAALFLAWHLQWKLNSLHGFMGIESISPWLSILLIVLIIVSVINSINLIDGIDGLAATMGIIMFTVFGSLFYLVESVFLMLTCVVMVGSLIAFLYYNLSKHQDKKIFMGDTGAFVIGFMLSVMAVNALALDIDTLKKLPFRSVNLPFIVAAILSVPLYDSIRVFILRVVKKKNPFIADRNHIHHLVIDTFKISHRRASFFLGIANFLIILLFTYLAMRENQWYILGIFLMLILVFTFFFYFLSRYRARHYLKNDKQK